MLSTMSTQSFQDQAGQLLKNYAFSDAYTPYVAIAGGIISSKLVYDFTHLISFLCFKSYSGLSRLQRAEWNNRAVSTLHAIFITATSLYVVFLSDLFSDDKFAGVLMFQSSAFSTFALGWKKCVDCDALSWYCFKLGNRLCRTYISCTQTPLLWISIGYFVADLGMIFWFHPALGGMEYVLHHLLSVIALCYSMLTREGQLYTYMVLISETTTAGVNLRWYLDVTGMKNSKAYLINGIIIFFAWLIARILLFVYIFYHVYLHFDEVKLMYKFGQYLVFGVPSVLAIMNLIWFGKICKGMKKTLSKSGHHV